MSSKATLPEMIVFLKQKAKEDPQLLSDLQYLERQFKWAHAFMLIGLACFLILLPLGSIFLGDMMVKSIKIILILMAVLLNLLGFIHKSQVIKITVKRYEELKEAES